MGDFPYATVRGKCVVREVCCECLRTWYREYKRKWRKELKGKP